MNLLSTPREGVSTTSPSFPCSPIVSFSNFPLYFQGLVASEETSLSLIVTTSRGRLIHYHALKHWPMWWWELRSLQGGDSQKLVAQFHSMSKSWTTNGISDARTIARDGPSQSLKEDSESPFAILFCLSLAPNLQPSDCMYPRTPMNVLPLKVTNSFKAWRILGLFFFQ